MAAGKVALVRWRSVQPRSVERYRLRLVEAGLDPVDYCEPGQRLDDCAGLVLTGGVDVDPRRYGESPHAQTQESDPARDAFEADVLWRFLGLDLPVLAICRGQQLLNVCLGGGLVQHIESGLHGAHDVEPYASRWHEIDVARGSRLASIIGEGRVRVNSRHHQAITLDNLAAGLDVTALCDDGVVEAVESEGHAWVVGVQWHPEREEEDTPGFFEQSARLFAAFAAATDRVSARA